MIHIRSTNGAPPRDRHDREPRQARSRQTLERILASAESLLADRLFEDVAMADIAREARVAVGTLYLRFPGKADLLPALAERLELRVLDELAMLHWWLSRAGMRRERIMHVVSHTITHYVQHRGLLRALTTQYRARPDPNFEALLGGHLAAQSGIAVMLLTADGGRPGRDDLAHAGFLLTVLDTACRDQLLFGELGEEHAAADRKVLRRRFIDLLDRELPIIRRRRSGSRRRRSSTGPAPQQTTPTI